MRSGTLPALLAAAALLGACTSTVVESTAADVPVAQAPDERVAVPADAYRPLDEFFDREGYLAGDIVEIECSLDPFKTRFVALLAAVGETRYVGKEEGIEARYDWVRLKNLAPGAAYQPNLLPTVTFGSKRREEPGSPAVAVATPPFRFVATQEIRVRFHHESEKDRPVWFQARAVGTPSPLAPETLRDSIYAVQSTGARHAAPEVGLALSLELQGRAWVPRIVEPSGGDGTGER